jgi:hypothetical protein
MGFYRVALLGSSSGVYLELPWRRGYPKGNRMFATRNAQYWLWFLLLGVVSILADVTSNQPITGESLWLLLTSLVGIIVGSFSSFSRPFDLTIGMLFMTAGIIGILHNFGIMLVAEEMNPSQTIATSEFLGLTLTLPYALIHTLIGITSLTQGVKQSVADAPKPAAKQA